MRILQVAPAFFEFQPGGTELCARSLHRAALGEPGIESHLLACVPSWHAKPGAGSDFLTPTAGRNETGISIRAFDTFHLSQLDDLGVLRSFRDFLQDYRPDRIHFHHLLYLGVEGIAVARRTCPDAEILLTLHDYYAICAHDGLMTKKQDGALCYGAQPHACLQCLPEASLEDFALREQGIRAALELVDRLIAPSAFLRERFIAWGIPEERIVHQPNALPEGWAGVTPLPPRECRAGEPIRFGFFANVMPHKGLHVLLEAALSLKEQGVEGFRIAAHGSDKHAPEAYKARIAALSDRLGASVSQRGGYAHEELPGLLAGIDAVIVPSVWWENDPLIVRQATAAGRPILYADLGGLAEAGQQSGGIPFATGDAVSLAERMLSFIQDTGTQDAGVTRQPTLAVGGQR
ncbi:glycosyltransferase [Oceanibaculum indicum]|uniref:Glycosyltransferase involved in cell wall biosynthesis n=1 Tax=Oceanibaculum indicum TaxID=526216 RepID=A0A420WGV6_9PROT|nr:glycosyltransferase [Oceanibaculum indicum]RKQ70179.1 glycosyltransferase involved in cell wall biosynthesis [Oceanibaculum indicum]